MPIDIKILREGDDAFLRWIAAGVFDNDVCEQRTKNFLCDANHNLALAIEDEIVIGFASAVQYIHPDKPAELWINEVGVAPTHQRRGIGTDLLKALFEVGRQQGCVGAWVLTDQHSNPAMRLYASLGGQESNQVMFSFDLTTTSAKPGPPQSSMASTIY